MVQFDRMQLKELKEDAPEGSEEKHVDRFKAAAEFWRAMPKEEKAAISQKFKVPAFISRTRGLATLRCIVCSQFTAVIAVCSKRLVRHHLQVASSAFVQ